MSASQSQDSINATIGDSGYTRFSIIVSSDPQYPWYDYILPGGLDGDCNDGSKGDTPINANSERQIREQYESMNKLIRDRKDTEHPVKGVIINGDLTAYGHSWQLEKIRQLMSLLKTQCYPSLGNHDYANNFASADNIAPSRMVDFMRSWLSNADSKFSMQNHEKIVHAYDCTGDTTYTSGSLAYSFFIKGVRFIQLQNYPSYAKTWRRWSLSQNYYITSSLDWFETQLQQAKDQHNMVVVFLHDYGDHFNSGDDFNRFNKLVKDYGVSAVFAGHIHQSIGYVNNIPNTTIPLFRSGSASFQDYLVVELEPPFLTVSPMACQIGRSYASTGYKWTTGPSQTGSSPSLLKRQTVQNPKNPPSAWPAPWIKSPLTGFIVNDRRYIYYCDNQRHICELDSDDKKSEARHRDLTGATKGKTPVFETPIVCVNGGDKTPTARAVFFISAGDNHIHRISTEDGQHWSDDDLTYMAARAKALALQGISTTSEGLDKLTNDNLSPVGEGSRLTCFGSGDKTHVFYFDKDGDVHQVYWNGATCADDNITTLIDPSPNPPLPKGNGGCLTCFGSNYTKNGVDKYEANVYYMAGSIIQELYWDGEVWRQNMPDQTGTELSRLELTCFGSYTKEKHYEAHVFYINYTGDICQLYWNGTVWRRDKISLLFHAFNARPATKSELACVRVDGNDNVFYVSIDEHVHQVYWNGSNWVNVDIMAQSTVTTGAAKPPAPVLGSPLVSLQVNSHPRVYYIGNGAPGYTHVQELWWMNKCDENDPNKGWHYNSLTASPPGW